jgi:hypothetical protein
MHQSVYYSFNCFKDNTQEKYLQRKERKNARAIWAEDQKMPNLSFGSPLIITTA